jgi:predicted acylesterase/phospholipase RssA
MAHDNGSENVLILKGGGSLGAFGCGVFKALA